MKVEVTMEKTKRMAKEFDVTEEECERISCGDLPDWIDKEFDDDDWSVADTETDYAAWDTEKGIELIPWR